MATTAQLEKRTDKLECIVFGNGQPGLDERMRNVIEFIEEQKAQDTLKKVNEIYVWMIEQKQREADAAKQAAEDKQRVKWALLDPIIRKLIDALMMAAIALAAMYLAK